MNETNSNEQTPGRSDVLAEQVSVLARQNAELRRGYLADYVEAELVFKKMATSVEDARRDRVRAVNDARNSKWKLRSIRARKWWRIGVALGAARRSVRDVLRLPVTVARIILSSEPRPSRPEMLSYGRKKPASTTKRAGFTIPAPRVPSAQAAELLLDADEYDEALRILDELLLESPSDLRLLKQKRRAHLRRGDLINAFDATAEMRDAHDTKTSRGQERHFWGRLRELDPLFLPTVPGTPEVVVPASDVVVMHLLKESQPYHERGYTMRSRSMLAAQQSTGWEPYVVTSLGFPRRDGFDVFDRTELVNNVEMERLDAGRGYDLAQVPWDVYLNDYAFAAARVVADRKPALIHAGSGYRGFDTALVGLALKRRFGIPLIYDVRSFLEHTWTDDMSVAEISRHFDARYETEVRCMEGADFVLTIGNSMRDELMSRGIPGSKIGVVPNAVDTEIFSPRAPDRELLGRYGLVDRDAVVGYVSNLGAREGIDGLVGAVAKLRAEGRNVAGLVVGDGPERGRLESAVRSEGISDAFTFTGQVPHDEVADHYALIDIFVVPRKDDYAARLVTPLKPFEAMAMGLPVVVSNLPGLVEIAEPGERGATFDPEDIDGLARVLSHLIDSPDEARRLAESGRTWVNEERTWQANADRYDIFYRAVIEGRNDVGAPA